MEALNVERLDRAKFSEFGDILETENAHNYLINNGNTVRFHDMARIDLLGTNPKAMISIFRGSPYPLPVEIELMERHPLGSQAFYPLQKNGYLVVVAPDEDGRPGVPNAFFATGLQGVNYHANVWHHPLLALNKTSDFIVVDRGGEGDNLQEHYYDEPYVIERV